MLQNQQNLYRIMARYNRAFNRYYDELRDYGVQRIVARNIFRGIVAYVLENRNKYTGNLEQRTRQLLNALQRDNPLIYYSLRFYRIPDSRLDEMFTEVIRMVLGDYREVQPLPPQPQP